MEVVNSSELYDDDDDALGLRYNRQNESLSLYQLHFHHFK